MLMHRSYRTDFWRWGHKHLQQRLAARHLVNAVLSPSALFFLLDLLCADMQQRLAARHLASASFLPGIHCALTWRMRARRLRALDVCHFSCWNHRSLTWRMRAPSLRVLDVASNALPCFGWMRFALTWRTRACRLRVLDVAANALSELGDGLAALAHLTDLWANDNRVADVRAATAALARGPAAALTCVYLAGNPAARPAAAYRRALLRALPRLEQLDSNMVDPEEAAQARRGAAEDMPEER